MKIVTLLFALFMVYACASSKQTVDSNTLPKTSPYDESFDPNTLNDDDIVITKYDQPVSAVKAETKEIVGNTENVEIKEIRGYRVQIIATKSIEAASQAEMEAKDIFDALSHKVYLIFDAPNYKVRVGDVASRDEADEIREIAKDYGYRGAFVVSSKVNVAVENK